MKAFGIIKTEKITPELAEKALKEDLNNLIVSAEDSSGISGEFEFIGYTTMEAAKGLLVKRLARMAALAGIQ